MNPVLVTNCQINQCTVHQSNFDSIFEFEDYPDQQSFIKPFIAVKKGDLAEILIDTTRLTYYKKLKHHQIPVYFLDTNCTFMELLSAATDYFLFDNSLNNRIIAKILILLENRAIDQKSYANFLSKKLKISPQKTETAKYRSFNQIIKPISDFLISKKAPLKGWEYMAEKEPEDQQFYARIIKALRPSLGNFLEISENLTEYQKLKPKYYAKLKAEIHSILENDDPNNKLQNIRNSIQLKRYPNLTQHRNTIDTLVSKLQLPKQLTLQYDRSFEKKELSGFFKLNSVADMDAVADFFNEHNRNILDKIIKKL